MGKNVTPRQRIALEELLMGASVKDAAVRVGVAPKTVYRWLVDPVFRAALDAATKDNLDNLSRRMAVLGNKAADTLEAALEYDIKAPGARVSSSRTIIDAIPKLRELANLEDRVTALEAASNEHKK